MLHFVPTKYSSPKIDQLELEVREMIRWVSEVVYNPESMQSFIIKIRIELDKAASDARIIKKRSKNYEKSNR